MSSRELLIIYCAGSFESSWAGPIFKPAVASGGECFKGTGDLKYPLLGKAETRIRPFPRWLEALWGGYPRDVLPFSDLENAAFLPALIFLELKVKVPRESSHIIPVIKNSLGGGQGNPLQYSCLENPTDRGAWRATVHGVTQSGMRPKRLSTHACKELTPSATSRLPSITMPLPVSL